MVAMPLGFYFVVCLLTLLLAVSVHCNNVPEGVSVECRDRYLWVSIEKPLADRLVQIEAFDDTGVYPITEKYKSECGYTCTYDDLTGNSILRASYLSCHTHNPTDEVFVFNFNLIIRDYDVMVSVPLSKTCTLSLPWSPREVICEHKYMEVSVRNMPCTSSGETSEIWGATLSVAHESATHAYKVLFLKGGEEVASMSIDDARMHGYVIDATEERIVFRAAYAQPDSEIKMINGIPVEVVHATVFFRRSWMVMIIDLTGACTTNLSSFDGERLLWETPMVLTPLMYNHSGFMSQQMRLGLEGQLLDMSTMNDWGYLLDIIGDSVWISVPYSAKGGYRWSFVQQNTYHEYYSVNLYYEHVFMDGSGRLTRFRQVKKLASPLLFQVPFTIDQTIIEEHHFTVYLGNFPYDVELLAVVLNGELFTVPEAILSGYPITNIPHSNGTHAYVIRVPFEDALVQKMYFSEGFLQYSLAINYTLNIMPQDPYYHSASVIAQIKDVFPPDFNGVCTETGIIFKMDHQKAGYLWEIGIGHYPLSTELAAQRGYILHNDSQSLILEVPVFTIGYIYEDISLTQFFGTFEILSRDAKTLEIQKSTAKRCLFKTDELIVCSPNGVVTVVASMTVTLPKTEPRRATLLDANCGPEEFDGTRVLFAFKVNTCGTRVMVDDSYVTYENEILVNRELLPEGAPVITRDADYRLTVRCHYPVNDVHQLFVDRKFKSETPGFGSVTQTSDSAKTTKYVPKQSTLPPHVPKRTTAPPTTVTTVSQKVTTEYVPVRYIRVTLG
ncbi:uncharacterized protein LOC118222599 [Anguilla anguilla]|uniref:uncharacterized protein LOC118222599 n=1 Tax=Anguilla anguilla TaxID=7936 RepID=UPI0015A7AE5D|nr:uncharacterized protein LOC118222599 [Anguilla anguilla]